MRHQIGVLRRLATAFLIPINHIGRATVSSIAVAHEVGFMGRRDIACLNARDRNVLGSRRDLLTAAAYGVEELLFVYEHASIRGERLWFRRPDDAHYDGTNRPSLHQNQAGSPSATDRSVAADPRHVAPPGIDTCFALGNHGCGA